MPTDRSFPTYAPRRPSSGVGAGTVLKYVLLGVAALLFIGGITVVGYQLDWWLKAENTDRQVKIDNSNLGTQTAWADQAKDYILEIEVLPADAPVRATLTRRACDLIGRLSDPYVTDDLASFQATECA